MPPTADLDEAKDLLSACAQRSGADGVKLALADRLALADLVHLYAAAVDDRRFGDVVELFTETAELRASRSATTRSIRCGCTAAATVCAPRWPRCRPSNAPSTRSSARCTPRDPNPDYALGRITCIAHHWTRRADQVTDLVWHLRYDDEYLRTPSGWRIHGRALTINAIETRPVRRLRSPRPSLLQ